VYHVFVAKLLHPVGAAQEVHDVADARPALFAALVSALKCCPTPVELGGNRSFRDRQHDIKF